MQARHGRLASGFLAALVIPSAAVAQQPGPIACRDRPCVIRVDWTRAGGIGSQVGDRRYGDPTQFEKLIKARLVELGLSRQQSPDGQALEILLIPVMGSAMCDEMAGTATDRSCQAIVDVEARLSGPDEVRRNVDLPSRIRNRCTSDKTMPVDRMAALVGDWIAYAVEGRARGDRRPVGRC
jgi:hypothetical protein